MTKPRNFEPSVSISQLNYRRCSVVSLLHSASTRLLRHRLRRIISFFAILILALLVIRETIALAHIQVGGPMPLAYAYTASPNFDETSSNQVTCIVLHATVEPTTEGTMGIFLNPAKKVSAHFIVGKDGRVVQMVPIEKRAWHAGNSILDGVPSVNNYSVGIEMVNLNDGLDPYSQAQMEAVAGLIRFIRSRYSIPDNRIVSHAQIALPAGRKSDPAGFDFDKIRAMARIGPTENVYRVQEF